MVFVYMSLFLSVPSFCVAEDGGFVENSLGSVYSLSALLLFIFLAATWFFIHACVSPVLPGLLLPRSARRLHREKEQRLLELEQLEKESVGKDGDTHREELDKLRAYFITSNANATASLHALYLVPAALFHALSSVILPSAQLVVARAAAAASKRVLLSEGGSAEGPDLLTANAAVWAAESKRRNIWDTYLAHWNEAPDFWGGENNPVVILSGVEGHEAMLFPRLLLLTTLWGAIFSCTPLALGAAKGRSWSVHNSAFVERRRFPRAVAS